MAENEKKDNLKVNLKISDDSKEEEKLRDFLGPEHENISEENLEKFVGYAKSGGLLWEGASAEKQVEMYKKFKAIGIGTVTAEPPIPGEEPKSEPEEKADDVIVTPPPEPKPEEQPPTEKPADPVKQKPEEKPTEQPSPTESPATESPEDQPTETPKPDQPKEEEATEKPTEPEEPVYTTGGPQEEESKPEMAEIVLLSYDKSDRQKEFAAYDALRDLVSIDSVVAVLRSLDDGDRQVISVPKSQKDEALEKLAAAGFVIEVPEPIEPEVTIEGIAAQIAELKTKVEGIKIPETDTQKQTLQDLLSQVAALAARIPEKPPVVDLTPISDKISETDKKVEELNFKILGGNDKEGRYIPGLITEVSGGTDGDGDEVFSLRKKIVGVRTVARSTKWWAQATAFIGVCLVIISFAILISVRWLAPPSPAIDQKALQTAVQAAMPTMPTATDIAAGVAVPTPAEIVAEMKKQGLIVPATATQTQTGGGANAPRATKK